MAKETLPRQPSTIPAKRQYLVFYNALSLVLWTSLIGRVFLVCLFMGSRSIYPIAGNFARWVQTLAVAEILHSVFGIVRAPVMTTAMQVASRLLLVWGIVWMFGHELFKDNFSNFKDTVGLEQTIQVQRNQYALIGMLTAWSVTEIIRYLYFVFFIGSGNNPNSVPSWLSWLRYNTFFVLYPVGISCECWLVYQSLPYAKAFDERYELALKAILAIYLPGSYILFTHMMAQRRRVMRGKGKVSTN